MSSVTDTEATATSAAVTGTRDTSEGQQLEAAVTATQDNSFMEGQHLEASVTGTRENSLEGQQLQAAMQHIIMLTEQNKSLHTQFCQLVAANTELFQRSVALQHKCNTLDAKNKETKDIYVPGLREN